MPDTPEAHPRQNSDQLLAAAGWIVQTREDANLPDPEVIAAEIAEDLQAAIDQYSQFNSDLSGR
jgi:hypothetical protein